MDHSDHINFLAAEGERLAVAAEAAGMEAKVPSCPRWRVVDLVGHVGMVHRWATQFVVDGITGNRPPPPDAMARPQDPDALMSWYRTGHRALVDGLLAAPEDLKCWYFLDAPSPLAFWARRQAHETAIHRADAELASGLITPHDPDLAADGIDEMLGGFVSGRRAGRLRLDPPRSLGVDAVDVRRGWVLHIGPEGSVLDRHPGDADCRASGTAGDLYLLLWNRLAADRVDVSGDTGVLDYWRKEAKVRWS